MDYTTPVAEVRAQAYTALLDRQQVVARGVVACTGGRDHDAENLRAHVRYLSEAVRLGEASLFRDYVHWAKVRHAATSRLRVFGKELWCLRDSILATMESDLNAVVVPVLDAALGQFRSMPLEISSHLDLQTDTGRLAASYLRSLLDGNRGAARDLIFAVLDRGIDASDIYLQVFQQSQIEVGRLWQTNQISVAQEHFCTAATLQIMTQVLGRVSGAVQRNGRRLVATCVGGDLHEVGIRIVSDFFELNGWDTYYLGADTPVDDVISAALMNRAHVLAVSVTMTYHLAAVEKLFTSVRSDPRCHSLRILVGGHPFNATPDLWRKVGADGFAADAHQALTVAGSFTLQ